jgi:type I restriction enzyme S subunit
MYGASIGKLGIAGRSLCTNQAIAAIQPDEEVLHRRYLYHYLLTQRRHLTARGRGGAQPNISLGDLQNWPIPLPDIPQQRRIAEILDWTALLGAKQRRILDNLDTLDRSLFLEMFGAEALQAVSPRSDRMHHLGWRWEPLNEVATMATGHTPDRERSEYWGGTIPWISLPDIRALDGKTAHSTSLYITESGLQNSSAVLLPVGTVCFSRTASIGFVTKTGKPMATSQDFHNWTPGPSLDADYLMAALRVSRPHLLGSSDGSTHKTIYQRVAERFNILLPPIELQRRFSRVVSSTDGLRDHSHQRLSLINELFDSLRCRAFSGQL